MIMTTSKGVWNVHLYMTKTDSAYAVILEAIENGNANQKYLQQKLGYKAPIIVDEEKKEIDFRKF